MQYSYTYRVVIGSVWANIWPPAGLQSKGFCRSMSKDSRIAGSGFSEISFWPIRRWISLISFMAALLASTVSSVQTASSTCDLWTQGIQWLFWKPLVLKLALQENNSQVFLSARSSGGAGSNGCSDRLSSKCLRTFIHSMSFPGTGT